MKIKYINHLGEEINLSKPPLMLEPVNAYNYSWGYEATESQKNGIKIGNFYRSKKEASMPMFIRGVDANGRGNLEAFNQALRLFFETVEKDIIAKMPGKLVLSNGEYMTCYIVEASHSNYAPRYRLDQREIKIVSPYPFWITESKKSFAPVAREEIEGEFLDYTLTPRLMFNQLVQNGNFASTSGWTIGVGLPSLGSLSVSNNVGTVVCSTLPSGNRGFTCHRERGSLPPQGHKLLITVEVYCETSSDMGFTSGGSTLFNKIVPAQVWTKLTLFTTNTSWGDYGLGIGMHKDYVSVGTQFKVRNFQSFDLTQMFGAGNEPTTVEEVKALLPNDYYEYNTGKPVYVADKNSPNLDYNYDYSYETPGIRTWNLDHYATSEFKLTIYGYCENPRILVNGYPYQIFGTVEENEFLVIDSREKTVTHYLNNGTTENWFDFRNKENSVFEPLPSGNLTLTWDGTYGFDILAYLERSEPRWT